MNHLEQNSTVFEEKARQTAAFIITTKLQCEQLIEDIKQMNDWLKSIDQQLNKYLVINLSTADEKVEAAKRMRVSFSIENRGKGSVFAEILGDFFF